MWRIQGFGVTGGIAYGYIRNLSNVPLTCVRAQVPVGGSLQEGFWLGGSDAVFDLFRGGTHTTTIQPGRSVSFSVPATWSALPVDGLSLSYGPTPEQRNYNVRVIQASSREAYGMEPRILSVN